jgi:anti-sigma factor ChrR (cupin superfamily)
MTPDMMTDNLARAQDTIARLTAQLAAANARAEHSENLLCRLFNASPVFNRDSLYQDMKEEILALRDKTACVTKTAETAPQPGLCDTSEPQPAPAVTVRLETLRPIWKAHGGEWHGPKVERWSIPEDQMVTFFHAALAAIKEPKT